VYAVDATVVVGVTILARSEVGGGLNAPGPSGNPPDELLGAANQLLCEGARCDRSLTTQRSPLESLYVGGGTCSASWRSFEVGSI
jgi:hypothetical protein